LSPRRNSLFAGFLLAKGLEDRAIKHTTSVSLAITQPTFSDRYHLRTRYNSPPPTLAAAAAAATAASASAAAAAAAATAATSASRTPTPGATTHRVHSGTVASGFVTLVLPMPIQPAVVASNNLLSSPWLMILLVLLVSTSKMTSSLVHFATSGTHSLASFVFRCGLDIIKAFPPSLKLRVNFDRQFSHTIKASAFNERFKIVMNFDQLFQLRSERNQQLLLIHGVVLLPTFVVHPRRECILNLALDRFAVFSS
jgi:hypothetical protein